MRVGSQVPPSTDSALTAEILRPADAETTLFENNIVRLFPPRPPKVRTNQGSSIADYQGFEFAEKVPEYSVLLANVNAKKEFERASLAAEEFLARLSWSRIAQDHSLSGIDTPALASLVMTHLGSDARLSIALPQSSDAPIVLTIDMREQLKRDQLDADAVYRRELQFFKALRTQLPKIVGKVALEYLFDDDKTA